MSQAFLISDSEIINHLYELNLRAYVAVNVTLKKDLDSTIKLLEQSPNVDVIVIFKNLSNEVEMVAEFKNYLIENELNVPVILMGDQPLEFSDSLVIKNKYDIKNLLMGVAKILELTPEQMVTREVPRFFPVPIKLLKNMRHSHCDLYSRVQKEDFDFDYSLIIEKKEPLKDVVSTYMDRGDTYLYIESSERLKFINKTSGFIINELKLPDLLPEERMEISDQGLKMVAEEIFEDQRVSEVVAEVSNACVDAINTIIKDVSKLRNLLGMLLERKSGYVYKHGIIATFIAQDIISNISWGSREQMEKVAFSVFFHDIFLVPVFERYPDALNEEDLLFRDDVSLEDKKTVLNHARLAAEMIRSFPRAPMGSDMIITQHHGMVSGRGFAVNYKDDISPLSKIIIIAEDIASGIIQDIEAGNKKDAIDIDRITKRLYERYSYQSYKKIIDTFQKIVL